MAWWNWGSKESKGRETAKPREDVVQKTARMVYDGEAQRLLSKHGLQILNVTWEDTGRSKGSCWGPNISDMTIQVQQSDGAGRPRGGTCMPVIRAPNFSDKTGDVPLDLFSVMVGNERGDELRRVSLRELLGDLRSYLHDPGSWPGEAHSLLAPERDSHVLVSPQACFLPIAKGAKAEFNPVLFNYQSTAGAPAVLTILATREGTSVTIIDNARDSVSGGQRLFFNANGERASFTGERKSEFLEAAAAAGDAANAQDREGMNMVLLIQVPLKIKRPPIMDMFLDYAEADCCFAAPAAAVRRCAKSDVEEAVIGHGEVEGVFTEIDGVRIERDPAFPIRATVQFYQATSNGVLSTADAERFAEQISRVYEDADYVGSLVVDGQTRRPTEWTGRSSATPLGDRRRPSRTSRHFVA
jgi:hypothetical protein